VTYPDLGSLTWKKYTDIKDVLDKALNGFPTKTSPLKKEKKEEGCCTFFHKTEFPCHKQSVEDNGLEAWSQAIMRELDPHPTKEFGSSKEAEAKPAFFLSIPTSKGSSLLPSLHRAGLVFKLAPEAHLKQ
jgi:hypothetical protein